jgi:hypothetical protein
MEFQADLVLAAAEKLSGLDVFAGAQDRLAERIDTMRTFLGSSAKMAASIPSAYIEGLQYELKLADSAYRDGEFFTSGIFYGKVFMDSVGLAATLGGAAIKGSKVLGRAVSNVGKATISDLAKVADELAPTIKLVGRRGPQRLVDFPEPMAGRTYSPAELVSDNPAIRASQRNGYLAELQLARELHFSKRGSENVLAYGRASGLPGADVISYNAKTRQVTLWDAKFKGSEGKTPLPEVISRRGGINAWASEAREVVQNSKLPKIEKLRALESIDSGQFNLKVAPYGKGDRGYHYRGIDLINGRET